MAGDHKCPVCNSTFTRPQHVARHMRSHTGDRPYKCQHCGDQFARSDLLSRHVNKCHASEKPPTTTAPNRRKGPTAASRATTSKQACDQCVQSSLPCDGCNPCSKCVSRKCRCTYIKFHRQTAPQGPGHPPPSQLLQHSSHSALASTSLGSSHPSLPPLSSSQYTHLSQYPHLSQYSQPYPSNIEGHSRTSSTSSANGASTRIPGIPDQFLLNAPTGSTNMATMGLSPSASYQAGALMDYPGYPGYSPQQQGESPTPSLTTSASTTSTSSLDGDMMARYRAQAELLSRTGLGNLNVPVSSSMNVQNIGLMQQQGMYDHGAENSQREAWGGQSFHNTAAKDDSNTGTTGGRGIPFPSETHTSSHNDGHGHRDPDDGARGPRGDRSEGFSSAFGLMSLDDPAVLAGLANDGEPFFSSMNDRGHSEGSPDGRDVHMGSNASDTSGESADSSATSGSHASSTTSVSSFGSLNFPSSGGTTPLATKEELKEFWRQYMRTPLTGPGSGNSNGMLGNLATPMASGNHMQLGHGENGELPQRPGFGTPSRRHSRVASLPSMKTPGVINEWNMFAPNNSNGTHNNSNNTAGTSSNAELGFNTLPPPAPFHLTLNPRRGRDASLSSTTSHSQTHGRNHNQATHVSQSGVQPGRTGYHGGDDLKSYEQAVLARKAPTQLNLVPRRRGTIHLGAVGGGLHAQAQQLALQQAKQAAQNRAESQRQQAYEAQAQQETQRPGSTESSSSLADAFGTPAMRPASGLEEGTRDGRRDVDSPTPSASASVHPNAMLGNMSPPNYPASASGSSSTASVHTMGNRSQPSSLSASPVVPSAAYRPSFKRLASQTLGPDTTKRALLGPAGWDDNPHTANDDDDDDDDEVISDGSEESDEGRGGFEAKGAVGGLRRMSAPSGARVNLRRANESPVVQHHQISTAAGGDLKYP